MTTRGKPLVALGAAILASAAAAQQGPVTLEFSFSNPGARSMGFGGAFVALADDATAAFANPAGLVQLRTPEVSIEGRWWAYSTPFTAGGRLEGEPTGIGLDDTAALRRAESSQTVSGLSFLSYVYPAKRWSLALYRHQLAKFELRTETQGLFAERVPRYLDRRTATDLEVVTYGLSGAYRLHDRLSIGISLAHSEGTWRSRAELYRPDQPEQLYGATSYLPERRHTTWTVAGVGNTDWAFHAGVLWRCSERWRAGAFYRQGPRFRFAGEVRAGPAAGSLGPEGSLIASASSPVALPDVFGLGVAFRAGERLTLTFEWDRVEYGDVLESIDQDQFPAPGQVVDDGDELHLGAEYTFLRGSRVLALRLGAWRDPDHRVRSLADDPLERATLRPGEDTIHYAVGLGLAFERFAIDLGLELSELVNTASLSMIYYL